MRLVVDASTLVAESLRVRGRALLNHSELDLAMAAPTWSETRHELRKRADLIARRIHPETVSPDDLLRQILTVIEARVAFIPEDVYASRLLEARRRIPRDPEDTPVVALALALDSGIWTADRVFFGCGLPVWTSETLQMHLRDI